MNEGPGGMPERADAPRPGSTGRDDSARPSLTTEVRRRRTDQEFFLRLRDAIQQNHKALERLGT
jgi:hypothetical protein